MYRTLKRYSSKKAKLQNYRVHQNLHGWIPAHGFAVSTCAASGMSGSMTTTLESLGSVVQSLAVPHPCRAASSGHIKPYLRSLFAPRACPPAARATTPHARARPPRARPSHASPAHAVTRLTSTSPPRAARRHGLARRRGAWPLAHHQLQRTAVADALRCHRVRRP